MIEIGSTIFLDLEETTQEQLVENTNRFRCRLVDHVDGTFIIDYPINQETEKPNFFFDGTEFRASFIGKDSAVYTFDTEIIGRKKGNIPVLFLKDPGKEKYLRIQRRNYVRVESSVDVSVHAVNAEFKPFNSVTLDLSGGGCSVLIPQGTVLSNVEETVLWLVLHMQSGEVVYAKTRCKIVRVFRTKQGGRKRMSLQFIEVNDQDQQKIIRYCFERQLILRRKNLM